MNDKKNGKGNYSYHNSGDFFNGEWLDNLKYGRGVYKYANGDVYDGNYIDGMKNGLGV